MCRESQIDFSNYEVHEDGLIFSKGFNKKRNLEGSVKRGYTHVKLKCTDGKQREFRWHRVIWYFFNGEIPEGMQVNHIDENKLNNALSNLNLMTPSENINWGTCIERRVRTFRENGKNSGEKHYWYGKKRPEQSERMKGINNPVYGTHRSQETRDKIGNANSKLVNQYTLDGEYVKTWKSSVEAEKIGGFSCVCVRYCCKGKIKQHKGFIWRYAST